MLVEFPVCVCTELHPGKKQKKILRVVFTAGFSQIGTDFYCQWHQSLHHLPRLEAPNGSPRPQASCRHGVWKRPIWILQVYHRPPPRPENIYQKDVKSRLTDNFSHRAPMYVIKSCIFRARKDLRGLLGQRPHATKKESGWAVSQRRSSQDTCWLVTEPGPEASQAS